MMSDGCILIQKRAPKMDIPLSHSNARIGPVITGSVRNRTPTTARKHQHYDKENSMAMILRSGITGRFTVLTFVLYLAADHAAAQPQYSVTDLGTLAGFDSSQAGSINASGKVAGWSSNTASKIDHASVWGPLQDLGTLPGFSSTAALAINAPGQAAGPAYNSTGPSHAFVWTSGVGLTDIHASDTFNSSEALGINGAGQIVGQLTNIDGVVHSFLWSSGAGMSDLGAMLNNGFATGINDAGQVVGTSWDDINGIAFLWTAAAGFTDLGNLPGFQYAWATAINASGQVVGQVSNNTGPIDGFLWTAASGMTDLGALAGFAYIQPYAINAGGVVVGEASNDPASGAAFIWNNGVMMDLNTLIPSGTGWVLKIATGINDNGQITGTGTIGGLTHAFLLTPTVAQLRR